MWIKKKVIIPETHRGLLYKEEQFQRLLMPGVYRWWDWKNQLRVRVIDISDTLVNGVSEDVLKLQRLHPEKLAGHLHLWQTAEQEVGLVYHNQVLKEIKAPGQQGAYWLGFDDIEIRKIDISTEFKLEKTLAGRVLTAKEPQLRNSAMNAVITSTVPERHLGFLEVDGEQDATLRPGIHAWWKFNRTLTIRQIDLRLQNMEVNGQEILSKDRVSLRINLSATWRVADARKVSEELADHTDFLYRELQLALRAVVSTQTLDELLEDKNRLNRQVRDIVVHQVADYGLHLNTVGARDIVLPGDMKTILAQVVEAQKRAEANLIKRREETQATRSLHNTAKVMEGNPTLLRLKELEVLEKITSQIKTLNVYGGLDGVMNDMVRISPMPEKP